MPGMYELYLLFLYMVLTVLPLLTVQHISATLFCREIPFDWTCEEQVFKVFFVCVSRKIFLPSYCFLGNCIYLNIHGNQGSHITVFFFFFLLHINIEVSNNILGRVSLVESSPFHLIFWK